MTDPPTKAERLAEARVRLIAARKAARDAETEEWRAEKELDRIEAEP